MLGRGVYISQFGVEGRLVFLTFGLLSPNKGIEHALKALPEILAGFPNVVYIVLGATHPKLVREHGAACWVPTFATLSLDEVLAVME